MTTHKKVHFVFNSGLLLQFNRADNNEVIIFNLRFVNFEEV